MTTKALGKMIGRLRSAALRRGEAALTDAELLERYISRRDEAAFEALVRQHGPMVLGLCRRVLGNEADAEDAFQATFLVLVRKAASIRSPGSFGSWLYGVAHKTALKARAMNEKRRARERQAGKGLKVEAAAEAWREVHALLDTELSRLPEKYRVAILMCALEGKTIKEAARQLGWAQGTMAIRLRRGRALLARRLAKHGLVLSAAVLSAMLSRPAAVAGVPPALIHATLKAAGLMAAGRAAAGSIGSNVVALTEGVLKTMTLSKAKVATAMLLAAILMASAVVHIAGPSVAGQQTKSSKKPAPVPKQEARSVPMWRVRATLEGHTAAVNCLALSPDGKLLASASDDSTVKIWNPATAKEIITLKESDGGGIRGVAFAPDGKTLATAGGDKAVRLWDAAKGTQLQQFIGHTAATYSVRFTPDGKTLVSGGGCANYPDRGQNGYGEVRFWDPLTGKERTSLNSHTWPVAHLAFTSDAKTLISGGYDNSFKLWDYKESELPKERLSVEAGTSQGLYAMALSPSGSTLVMACDGIVKSYDLATGKERDGLEKCAPRNGWLWGAVAFSADGKTIAAASPLQEWEDKDKNFVVQRRSIIMFWDTATGKLRDKLSVDECVTALAFSPDGKTLITGCRGKMRQPRRIRQLSDIETENRGVVLLWSLKSRP
jgi:RNA polymerase sigma factor (sigma-70 family)